MVTCGDANAGALTRTFPDGAALAPFLGRNCVWNVTWSHDGQRLIMGDESENAALYVRRRPESWWGLAWLPEFWLTLVLGCAFLWSVCRDRKVL